MLLQWWQWIKRGSLDGYSWSKMRDEHRWRAFSVHAFPQQPVRQNQLKGGKVKGQCLWQ
jgi:hypothetical protein